MGLKKNISYIVVGLGIICAIASIAIFVNANRFQLKKYVKVTYTGANGYATPSFEIDRDKLYDRLAGKNPDEEKAYNVRKLVESINVTTECTDVKNGNKIKVDVSFNQGYEKAAGVSLGKNSYSIRAKGIKKGEKIDIFDSVDVMFNGVSPDAKVVITNNWEDEYLNTVTFSADKESNIALGDSITVSCNVSYEDMARHGYLCRQMTATFNADRLSTYCESAEKIDKDIINGICKEIGETIKNETLDTTFRMLYKATKNTDYLYHLNDETADNIKILDKYFLTRKSGQEGNNNYIYIVASADVHDNESTENVFFIFQYVNAYTTIDGNFDIGHDNENKRYSCSTDMDALYQEIIGEKQNSYNIEKFY